MCFVKKREVWEAIGWLFSTDDAGALSVVTIDFPDNETMAAAYVWMRDCAGETTELVCTFWSLVNASDIKISSVPNAAAIVADGSAEAFHVAFSGIVIDNMMIPRLGVHVFPSKIEIDYCPGCAWNADGLWAFLAFLNQVIVAFPGVSIHPYEHWDKDTSDLFVDMLLAVRIGD